MEKMSIIDIICNVFKRESIPGDETCGTGERLPRRGSGLTAFGKDPRRMAELKRMVELQERVVLKMINGDPEEFLPLPPQKATSQSGEIIRPPDHLFCSLPRSIRLSCGCGLMALLRQGRRHGFSARYPCNTKYKGPE